MSGERSRLRKPLTSAKWIKRSKNEGDREECEDIPKLDERLLPIRLARSRSSSAIPLPLVGASH